MWLEAVLIGLLIGIFRGGRLNQLDHLHLRGALFLVAGLLIQMVPFFLHFKWISDHAVYFTGAGIVIALGVILFNVRSQGIPFVALGTALQLVVLIFHQGRMPIRLMEETSARLVQLRLAIEAGEIANYAIFSASDHWSRFLGKVLIMPSYYPFSVAIGIPDILIGIGVAWYIQSVMMDYRPYGHFRRYRPRRY